MKYVFVLLASLVGFSQAQAKTFECTNRFGTIAYVQIKENKLKMTFSHPAYKSASGKLSGGVHSGKLYFRKVDKIVAVVDASILETGKSRVTYYKPNPTSGTKSGQMIFFHCN